MKQEVATVELDLAKNVFQSLTEKELSEISQL